MWSQIIEERYARNPTLLGIISMEYKFFISKGFQFHMHPLFSPTLYSSFKLVHMIPKQPVKNDRKT